MPSVVVITAVVIVNNGDDNAWCFVPALSFWLSFPFSFFFIFLAVIVAVAAAVVVAVAPNQTGSVGRGAAAAAAEERRISHTESCTLLLFSAHFELKTKQKKNKKQTLRRTPQGLAVINKRAVV